MFEASKFKNCRSLGFTSSLVSTVATPEFVTTPVFYTAPKVSVEVVLSSTGLGDTFMVCKGRLDSSPYEAKCKLLQYNGPGAKLDADILLFFNAINTEVENEAC